MAKIKRSYIWRKRSSIALKGRKAWNKGTHNSGMKNKKHSLKTKEKMSKARKGIKYSIKTRKKISKTLMGRKIPIETRIKMSKNNTRPMLGKKHTQESIEKMSKAKIGTKQSEKTKEKMSISHRGPINYNWSTGKHRNYGVEFTPFFKKQIKQKFNNICQLQHKNCTKIGTCIHHIDYDGFNNDEKNLTILCRTCHARTNPVNKRNFWKNFFQKRKVILLS